MVISKNLAIDLVYKNIDDKDLELTFLPPINKIYEKSPVYFLIPGGGWHTAKRESMIDFSKLSVDMLRDKGFAVVAIDYRTANEQIKICDIICDCFDAIGFLAEYSENLQIDVQKIVVSGHSAGAHLALMVANANGNQFTNQYNFDKNLAKVTVVAALSPATVLYEEEYQKTIGFGINYLFKNPDDLDERKKASPIEYVSALSPSTILFAGTSDPLIYSKSSEILYDKLVSNKVNSKLVLSKNAGHSFEKLTGEKEPSISFEEIQKLLVYFVLENF